MIHDFGGGSPCQGWVYCDDGLPEKYARRIFHCEWGQGKIWAVKVQPDGCGVQVRGPVPFVDPTGTGVKDFRPYSIRPMADGCGFWITDWRSAAGRRRKSRGDIYKVTYVKDDVKPAPRWPGGQTVQELVKALSHPAHSERLHIQRLIDGKLTNGRKPACVPEIGSGVLSPKPRPLPR